MWTFALCSHQSSVATSLQGVISPRVLKSQGEDSEEYPERHSGRRHYDLSAEAL